MKHTNLSRRSLLLGAGLSLAAGLPVPALARDGAAPLHVMQVSKSPTCGCCGAWVNLARNFGFEVEVTETDDYAGMKEAAGVPEHFWSCHTARVGGYIVEGHVPFAAIEHLLIERADVVGISVPGMPQESPGMDGGADAVVDVTAWGGSAGDGAAFPFDAR